MCLYISSVHNNMIKHLVEWIMCIVSIGRGVGSNLCLPNICYILVKIFISHLSCGIHLFSISFLSFLLCWVTWLFFFSLFSRNTLFFQFKG